MPDAANAIQVENGLPVFSQLQLLCHLAEGEDLEAIHASLESGEGSRVLRALGIHVGIFAYRDPEDPSGRFYYLTDDEESPWRRNLRWPFLVDDEDGTFSIEDSRAANSRLELAGMIRRHEYQERPVGVSHTLERLATVRGATPDPRTSALERDLNLLFSPMGEILAALLAWHVRLLGPVRCLSFPDDLDLPLARDDRRHSSPTYDALAHIAEQVYATQLDRITDLPTIALMDIDPSAADRPLIWAEVLCDLGLIRRVSDRWTCSGPRIRALAEWLAAQDVDLGYVQRPAIPSNPVPEVTGSRFSRNVAEGEQWELLNTSLQFLTAEYAGVNVEWLFTFGFANHLCWMSVGRSSPQRWAEPYDWVCFEVLRHRSAALGIPRSSGLPASGIAFLTCRSEGLHDEAGIRRRLAQIRSLTLTLSMVEDRLTYFDTVARRVITAQHYRELNAVMYSWSRELYHEMKNATAKTQGAVLSLQASVRTLADAHPDPSPATAGAWAKVLSEAQRAERLILRQVSTLRHCTKLLPRPDADPTSFYRPLPIHAFVQGLAADWPAVSDTMIERDVRLVNRLPEDWATIDHGVVKVGVVCMLHNAARHSKGAAEVWVEKDGNFLVISNMSKSTAPHTARWTPLVDLQANTEGGRQGGEGVSIIANAARYFRLPEPEYRNPLDGLFSVRFALPLPSSHECDTVTSK